MPKGTPPTAGIPGSAVWGNITGDITAQTDLYSYLKQFTRVIDVDPTLPVIAGHRYQTYADAITYILANTTPSYFNRWAVFIHGWLSGVNPSWYPWIVPMGLQGGNALVSEGNWVTVGGATHADAYQMFNLSTGGVNPAANTIGQCIDCTLNDQETTSGTGTIWLRRSEMYDGDNNADLSSCSLIIDGDSVAIIQIGGAIQCYGAYYLTIKGDAVGSLECYGAGGAIYFNTDVTIGWGYIYGAELYGVNFAVLGLQIVGWSPLSVTGNRLRALLRGANRIQLLASLRTITFDSADSQLINTILYDVDVVADGITLETVGCMRGLGTENISTAGGGTWTNRGDIGAADPWVACALAGAFSGTVRVRTENYGKVVRLEGTINNGGANVGLAQVATIPAGFRPSRLAAVLAANKLGQGTGFTQCLAKTTGELETTTDGAAQDIYFNTTWHL